MNDTNPPSPPAEFPRPARNKGKLTGPKPPLRPGHVWSIRAKLQLERRVRDLALFNLAIDSKLRGCDLVALRVDDVAPNGYAVDRATVRQSKTGRPVRFELTEVTRHSLDDYLRATGRGPGQYLFPGRRGPDAHLMRWTAPHKASRCRRVIVEDESPEGPSMTRITTIGVDLAKKVFQVHGVDAEGKVVVARKLRRKEVLTFFAKLAPCLVGMEACGSAHYWAREIGKLGHTVKLMPPKYVKAYVKRGKTDAGDAAAICEAVTRPSMSFVPVKGVEQQGLSMLHSARSQLIGQRTQLINAVRGHLSELGIIAARGLLGLAELAAIVRDESDRRLTATARAALMALVRQVETVTAQIAAVDGALRKENKASDLGPRLETIPSVGPVIASALRARVTEPTLFENGRHLSAWIGIVPENDSTGGKIKQKGLSKKGDRYLRSLLVNGAMAVVRQAQIRPDKHPWVTRLLGRMSAKQAAIAIANKTARVAWAIMAHGGIYEAGHRPAHYRGEACAASGSAMA